MSLNDVMGRLGFTKYEGEAYATLLRFAPMTGYELGKRSGVPLSKCYVTLQRLVEKGAAFVEETDPPRYAPVMPASLVESRKTAFLADLDALLRTARRDPTDRDGDRIWCAIGRTSILNLAGEMIRESRQRVSVEVDPSDLELLASALDEARQRVTARMFHPGANGALASGQGRILVLSDDRRILAGTTSPDKDCRAVSTTNPGLVTVVSDRFRSLEAAASAPALRSMGRGAGGSWLVWEDRKHQDLIGCTN